MIPTTPPRGRLKLTPSYRRRFPFALPRSCTGGKQDVTPDNNSRGQPGKEGYDVTQKLHGIDERLHRMKPSAVTPSTAGTTWRQLDGGFRNGRWAESYDPSALPCSHTHARTDNKNSTNTQTHTRDNAGSPNSTHTVSAVSTKTHTQTQTQIIT